MAFPQAFLSLRILKVWSHRRTGAQHATHTRVYAQVPRHTRRRSRDSCRPMSRSPGPGDRLLGASTRRRRQTLINNEFDIEHFHWSSLRFTAFWRQAFLVCTARERGTIGLAAFKGDWAWRIRAFDFLEFPGSGVAPNHT